MRVPQRRQDKQKPRSRICCSLLLFRAQLFASIMLAAIAGPCGFVCGGLVASSGTGYHRRNGVSLLSVTTGRGSSSSSSRELVVKRCGLGSSGVGLWLLRRWWFSHQLCSRGSNRRGGRRPVHACSLNNTLTADGQGIVQSRKQEHEQSIDLKEWMHEQGMPECKVALVEASPWDDGGGKSKPIHYVVASEELQCGEVALAVPKSLVVTLEKVLGDETIAELLTTNKLSELACLALYLMYEKKQAKESYWYPYIRELDRQRGRGQLAVESPLLWSQEEVEEYFAGSPMREVISERLEGIKREYGELDTVWFMAGSLFKQYPFDIPTEAFSFEIFKQAFVAVQSCVVHLQGVSLARRFALVPLGPPLLAYKSNCKAMLKAVGDFVQLEVDRPYRAGEPIVVWCGPQPNSRLLLNYGFVDEDNPYDRLSVEASLETADPLYQQKRIIVQRNNRLTVQTFQIYKGREKEAVLEMLPYLRLGNLSDPHEMESVIFAQGPVCPVSPCNERAVLDQLVSYFKRRLAGYQSSNTAELEDYKINPKKRVATQLLNIEKEILKNALVALDEFIDQLPDSSISSCSGAYAPHLK